MFIPTALTTLATLARVTAAPYPLSNSSSDVGNVMVRSALPSAGSTGRLGSSSCSAGSLMCSHDGKMFAICTSFGQVTWQPVAAGTVCSCQGGGQCAIAPANAIAGDSPNPGRLSSAAPMTFVSVTMTPPSSSSAAATAPSSAAPTSASTWPAGSAPASSAPASSAPAPSGSSGPSSGAYGKTYSGNGSPSDGWPTESDFLSFDTLWEMNMPILKTGCSAFSQKDNSPTEIADLRSALLSVSKEAGVDPVFSLAIALQESNGCLAINPTNNGVVNNGIFQSHDGSGTCYNKSVCPNSELVQMCKDGIEGTGSSASAGPGLKQLIQKAGSSGAEALYRAARMYNSGSIAADGNLSDANGATACYVSDVANRLLGWSTGTTGCTLSA